MAQLSTIEEVKKMMKKSIDDATPEDCIELNITFSNEGTKDGFVRNININIIKDGNNEEEDDE